MALKHYGVDSPIEYEGAVLETREENGYHDSDFYALVWDGKRIRKVYYGTTRFANMGWARVDATPEVKAMAKRWSAHQARKSWVRACLTEASTVRGAAANHRLVKIVKGRKGRGVIGWAGWYTEAPFEPWNKQYGDYVSVDPVEGSGRIRVAVKNVEVVPDPDYAKRTLRERLREARRWITPDNVGYWNKVREGFVRL